MNWAHLKELLDERVDFFNQPEFIENDPISVPHRFVLLQDVEISGLFAAIFAWGQRKTAIAKANHLVALMENAPFQFLTQSKKKELERLNYFVHRTFNGQDLLSLLCFLKDFYSKNQSLELAFTGQNGEIQSQKERLIHFAKIITEHPDFQARTKRHIPDPARNSACKRINMFLRWMVRRDDAGVDFGLWKKIHPSELYCPLDVHVDRVARHLGLLSEKQPGWKAVEQLTANLRLLDPKDPVKYDFALFGIGMMERKSS